jgi:hypothetical protein
MYSKALWNLIFTLHRYFILWRALHSAEHDFVAVLGKRKEERKKKKDGGMER